VGKEIGMLAGGISGFKKDKRPQFLCHSQHTAIAVSLTLSGFSEKSDASLLYLISAPRPENQERGTPEL